MEIITPELLTKSKQEILDYFNNELHATKNELTVQDGNSVGTFSITERGIYIRYGNYAGNADAFYNDAALIVPLPNRNIKSIDVDLTCSNTSGVPYFSAIGITNIGSSASLAPVRMIVECDKRSYTSQIVHWYYSETADTYSDGSTYRTEDSSYTPSQFIKTIAYDDSIYDKTVQRYIHVCPAIYANIRGSSKSVNPIIIRKLVVNFK